MLPVDFRKSWTTHIGVLTRVLLISGGDVVELGAGPASTPLLHWICKDMGRKLITYENHPDFYNYARQFQSRLHRIGFVKNWDEVDTKTPRGVVLIDHAPADRRQTDVIRFKDSARFIVMHDTNYKGDFNNVWPNFKFAYTWKECRPWVSVVSNFKDLSNLERKT